MKSHPFSLLEYQLTAVHPFKQFSSIYNDSVYTQKFAYINMYQPHKPAAAISSVAASIHHHLAAPQANPLLTAHILMCKSILCNRSPVKSTCCVISFMMSARYKFWQSQQYNQMNFYEANLHLIYCISCS